MTAFDGLNGEPVPGRPGYVTGDCSHPVTAARFRDGGGTCDQCPGPERWAEVEMLDTGSYYTPRDRDSTSDTCDLVQAATDSGIIADTEGHTPGQPKVAFAFEVSEDYSVYYCWMLHLDGGPTLVTGQEELRYFGSPEHLHGAQAAVEVLNEAVSAANGLLAQLDAYCQSRLTRHPAE
jgi:hypothetical protein